MTPLKNSIMQHKQEFGHLTFTDKKQRKKFLDTLAATKLTYNIAIKIKLHYLKPESVTPLRHRAQTLDSTAAKKIPA